MQNPLKKQIAILSAVVIMMTAVFSTACLSSSEVKKDVPVNIGDVNLDGRIGVDDISAIQRHLSQINILTDEQLAVADTNGDGFFNISDASHIQMYLAEYDVVLGKRYMRQIAHRGCSAEAPENTLPAFRLAKEKGFEYIETDVQRTYDGRYVLRHDSSLNISTVQFAEEDDNYIPTGVNGIKLDTVKKYDVGKVNGEVSYKYRNTRVPTLEEGLQLCKELGLKMYIEFKGETLYNIVTPEISRQYIGEIIEIVKQYDMLPNVSFCSVNLEILSYARDIVPSAPLVTGQMNYGTGDYMKNLVASVAALKTPENDVVIGIKANNCQKDSWEIEPFIEECKKNEIRVGAWFENATDENEEMILNVHPYVSEFTTNKLLARQVLKDNETE